MPLLRLGVLLGALVSLLALCARATPTHFVAGTFTQAHGFELDSFGQYVWTSGPGQDFEFIEKGWHRGASEGSDAIRDMAPVKNGVFAVGSFTSIGSVQSSGVAYWNGKTWCGIRQSIYLDSGSSENDGPYAVTCPDDDNCYVLGDFYEILNTPGEERNVAGFVHYRWSESANEWVVVHDVEWSFGEYGLPDLSNGAKKLMAYDGDFFVIMGDFEVLYRGGANYDGWIVYTTYTSKGSVQVYDYDIYGGTLYLTAGDYSSLILRAAITVDPPNWDEWYLLVDGYSHNLYGGIFDVHVVHAALVYFVGLYDPDGEGGDFSEAFYVMRVSGNNPPVPVGPYLARSYGGSGWDSNPVRQLWADPLDGAAPMVSGDLFEGNFHDDDDGDDGDSAASRALDELHYVARFSPELGRWESGLGGGVDGVPARVVYSARTGSFYVAGPIGAAYDLVASHAAYYDDGATAGLAPRPWRPLLARAVRRRGAESEEPRIGAVLPPSGDGARVFFAGRFDYVGPKQLGSVGSVLPGNPYVVYDVGGGLWDLAFNEWEYPNENALASGDVRALAASARWLFAAGRFERSLSGNCLQNVARLPLDAGCAVAGGAEWEDLGGGCDGIVHALALYGRNLVATGSFSRCGGLRVNNVALFVLNEADPAREGWRSLNGGLDDEGRTLAVFGSYLVVGGRFDVAGGLNAHGIAAWQGTEGDGSWRPVAGTCDASCEQFFSYAESDSVQVGYARALSTNEGFLYAVGEILESGDSVELNPRKRGWDYGAQLFRFTHHQDMKGTWNVRGGGNTFATYSPNHPSGMAHNDTTVVVGTTYDNPHQSHNAGLLAYSESKNNFVDAHIGFGGDVLAVVKRS